MKRILFLTLMFLVGLLLGFHGSAAAQSPVSLSAFKARTQVGARLQHVWLSRAEAPYFSPRKSWEAVVPAAYNLTPRTDLTGSFAYNFTTKEHRWTFGAQIVVFGAK